MTKRLGAAILALTGIAAVALPGATRAPLAHAADPDGLTVHEWGTFTSIAGPDGQAMPWRPLTGPSDLPCFVTALNPNSVKTGPAGIPGITATVRMETPVLYFYSAIPRTLRVGVTFYRGIISEWYRAPRCLRWRLCRP